MENSNGEILYLKVPVKYKPTYNRLLRAMADFGKDIVINCERNNTSLNNSVITCWNMFQTVLACNELGRDKEAEFYLNYINKQMDIVYKNSIIVEYEVITQIMYVGSGYDSVDYINVNDSNYFTKYDIFDNLVGKCIINNPIYGNYGWICVPDGYGEIVVKGDDDLSDIELKPAEIRYIDEKKYKYYRTKNRLVDGIHIINIKYKENG